MQEKDTIQYPVYFVSKVLKGAELHYKKVEKLALVVVISASRLRPYFKNLNVIVRSDPPVRQVL